MDKAFIEQRADFILKETNFPQLGERKVGKVRDVYFQDDKVALISTDRHSSFDRIIAHIPFKGQVLTQTSKFWFDQTKDIVRNHVLDNPDPNVIVASQHEVIPIEVVVRGYLTGVTETSIWTHYQAGQREFGGLVLADGLAKNQKLERPILTPTTKASSDKPITAEKIVSEGIVKPSIWQQVEEAALQLFARGQELAAKRGLILVDTKYEFGMSGENIVLIDEIHTSDSSRYWQAATYEERFAEGQEPEYFDKEFLRLWFRENCDPYKDDVLPEAPIELVTELAHRYISLYEQLTGQEFVVETNKPIEERIANNLQLKI